MDIRDIKGFGKDELFEYYITNDCEAVVENYRKDNDPSVTRVEIPAVFNGYPVTSINRSAFFSCPHIQEVYIPDSVKRIGFFAFNFCPELREIRFPKDIEYVIPVSLCCPKLPVETILAGFAEGVEFEDIFLEDDWFLWEEFHRTDVFERVIHYRAFWRIGLRQLLMHLVYHNLVSHFKILETVGMTLSAEKVDALIKYSTRYRKTEMTAYLLDFKNRTIGFSGGDKFEL